MKEVPKTLRLSSILTMSILVAFIKKEETKKLQSFDRMVRDASE